MSSDATSAPTPDKCYIYHITHVSNLPSILTGGLLCELPARSSNSRQWELHTSA